MSSASPRIAPLPLTGHEPAPLNIFRTLNHNPLLAKGFLALGGHLLSGGVLPARVRELVILRVGFRAASEYEFGQHTRLARDAGLTDEEIRRLTDAGLSGWNDDDRALLELADELCDDDLVSAPTWQRLSARWSDSELLELLVLAGYYRLVSGMLNSVGVALEPDAPGWPEGVDRRPAPREAQA